MKAEFKLSGNFKQKNKLLLFILCSFVFLVIILLLSHQALPLLRISSKVISASEEDQLTKRKIISTVNSFIIIKQAYAQKQDIENNITNTTTNSNETSATIKYIKTAAQ